MDGEGCGVVTVNKLSHCCTMKDYTDRMSHKIVANDQNPNRRNGHREAG